MSERTVLVDEEMAVDNIMHIGSARWEAVVLESGHICTVDDPFGPDPCYCQGDYPQVPALFVPEGTVRGGDRLHVTVELVRGGADE